MAKTIVITGGNSGIGLEVARQLSRDGHHVILLGRDEGKGAQAVEELTKAGGTAEFWTVDLGTHAGVKAAAESLAQSHPKIDALVLGAGVLTFRDLRTPDGLHPVFAVNYLSRYHLAQRLLPQLRAAGASTVVLLVAGVSLKARINFKVFPRFDPFPGPQVLSSIQIANHHYVAHLARTEPSVRAAVANVGLVRTDILRTMSPGVRGLFNLLAPLMAIPVEKSASNAAWLTTHDGWRSGSYWGKPGQPAQATALALDPEVTSRVVSISRELTGA